MRSVLSAIILSGSLACSSSNHAPTGAVGDGTGGAAGSSSTGGSDAGGASGTGGSAVSGAAGAPCNGVTGSYTISESWDMTRPSGTSPSRCMTEYIGCPSAPVYGDPSVITITLTKDPPSPSGFRFTVTYSRPMMDDYQQDCPNLLVSGCQILADCHSDTGPTGANCLDEFALVVDGNTISGTLKTDTASKVDMMNCGLEFDLTGAAQ